ncbi:MAG: hypothetical protein QNJ07_08775, partial [Woeseiaceae bacterium]|nr:hypothetical protein [Woeseiaceae bacterium]
MFWEMLTIAVFALAVGTGVWLWRRGTARRDGAERRSSAAMPSGLKRGAIVIVTLALTAVAFNEMFFYAEPGYIYHVRTITGNERVVDGVGYSMHLFGRVNAWKKAMTVLADDTTADGVNAEGE